MIYIDNKPVTSYPLFITKFDEVDNTTDETSELRLVKGNTVRS